MLGASLTFLTLRDQRSYGSGSGLRDRHTSDHSRCTATRHCIISKVGVGMVTKQVDTDVRQTSPCGSWMAQADHTVPPHQGGKSSTAKGTRGGAQAGAAGEAREAGCSCPRRGYCTYTYPHYRALWHHPTHIILTARNAKSSKSKLRPNVEKTSKLPMPP